MILARIVLYALALLLYLLPVASWRGVLAAQLAAGVGLLLAGVAHRRRLRPAATVVLGLAALSIVLALGEGVLESRLVAALVGVRPSLVLSELITFGLGGLLLAFTLRRLSWARPSLALLEVLFVAGSVVAALADHRNRMLNRPRAFSDWAWSLGLDPGTVLIAVGIGAALAALWLLLHGQRRLKLLSTALFLALLGGAFFLLKERRLEVQHPLDPLGLSGRSEKKDPSKGQGQGSSRNPFKDDYSGSSPPSPVAIAILRDDYDPPGQLLYFRQTALSSYNGHHLVKDPGGRFDVDVLDEFPRTRPLQTPAAGEIGDYVVIPSTTYLMVDHPQPLALSAAVRLAAVQNPNPQQFVAAYDVVSHVLAIDPQRLLGRPSLPESWPAARRRHYLALPDDPRYQALSDIIVRELDPRYASDDLARAFAIKRYLEREGFYTMRSTHADDEDPTASFLFGSLRGYCVHFAHAAVFLMRSQGIAARVALGYAVQTAKRSGGSSILIMSDRAHAWPELHLAGVGWVTFDIYPERTDLPPPALVDYDLEKLLGELARQDQTAGVDPAGRPLQVPWRLVGGALGLLAATLLLLGYLIKAARRLAPALTRGPRRARLTYIAVLDRLSELGQARQPGETRERHAARLAPLSPHFAALTAAHLRQALGGGSAEDREQDQDQQLQQVQLQQVQALARQVREELRGGVSATRRLWGRLRPYSWLRTR